MREAEALFAEKGYAATSIRDIIAAADANLGAVHYHFGSKEELFLCILKNRLQQLNEDRCRRLNSARQGRSGRLAARSVVDAFLLPIIDLHRTTGDSRQLAAILGRTFSESPELKHKVFDVFFRETCDAFLNAFSEAMPQLDRTEIYWRFHFMLGAMIGALTAQDRLAMISGGHCTSDKIDEMIPRLVQFVTAGIET